MRLSRRTFTLHVTLELPKAKAGIEITHIPDKGSAPTIQAVMAGQVD